MGNSTEKPLGRLFSEVYLDRGEPASDSDRFRTQLTAAFSQLANYQDHQQIARLLELRLGISVPTFHGVERIVFSFDEWFSKCQIKDLLDAITVIASFFGDRDKRMSIWIAQIQTFFAQRNLKYEIDAKGGVHYRVDAAFQHSRELTLACLRDASYEAAKDELQKSFQYLTRLNPDTKMAVVNVFLAAENVFKLVTKNNGNLAAADVLTFQKALS